MCAIAPSALGVQATNEFSQSLRACINRYTFPHVVSNRTSTGRARSALVHTQGRVTMKHSTNGHRAMGQQYYNTLSPQRGLDLEPLNPQGLRVGGMRCTAQERGMPRAPRRARRVFSQQAMPQNWAPKFLGLFPYWFSGRKKCPPQAPIFFYMYACLCTARLLMWGALCCLSFMI